MNRTYPSAVNDRGLCFLQAFFIKAFLFQIIKSRFKLILGMLRNNLKEFPVVKQPLLYFPNLRIIKQIVLSSFVTDLFRKILYLFIRKRCSFHHPRKRNIKCAEAYGIKAVIGTQCIFRGTERISRNMYIRNFRLRCDNRSKDLRCFVEQIRISCTEDQSLNPSFAGICENIEYKRRDHGSKYTYEQMVFCRKIIVAFTGATKTLFCSFRECRYPAYCIPILR